MREVDLVFNVFFSPKQQSHDAIERATIRGETRMPFGVARGFKLLQASDDGRGINGRSVSLLLGLGLLITFGLGSRSSERRRAAVAA